MITMKDIVREGNPVLRKVAQPVELPPPQEDLKLLQEMLQFLINSQDPELAEKYELRPGSGLAAPQVGVSKRMFVMHTTDEHDRLFSYGFINPRIISHSMEETHLENGEGCLSVDRTIEGIVPRHARIRLRAQTLDGEDVNLRLRGLPAIVAQHEIDHLNGVMFYDRIEDYSGPYKKAISTI
ncbi:peptide deformylase [Geomicrobium halophilum]|uniref:Peptide deformylase n=1 Tax=Geomicrobium halophilum TaxID=549000 RepID=A0A841PL22_9BACL|nr:peptide deformylase [Geomicrobium halophilum]MBB6449449.1 peptide deformylase [Geomicrobium halophilum]